MSEKRYRDFLEYWDSRLDENEKILNSHPQLANFTFRECNKLWDTLHSDYNKLKSRHNALLDAIEKERKLSKEIDKLWDDQRDNTGESKKGVEFWRELRPKETMLDNARAEVDRLLEEGKWKI